MTSYIPPTNITTRLKYGPWHIIVYLSPDVSGVGIGAPLILAHETEAGWVVVSTIDGPYTLEQWPVVIRAGGGMGNYIVSKFPAIKAALKKYFDTTPELPIITNQTPFSIEAFNQMLYEYIELKDDPGTGHPTIGTKPYIPPS